MVKGDLEGKSRIDSGFEEEEEEEEEEIANTNKFFEEEKARIHKKRTQGWKWNFVNVKLYVNIEIN